MIRHQCESPILGRYDSLRQCFSLRCHYLMTPIIETILCILDLKQPAKTPPFLWTQEDYVVFRPLIIDAVCSGMNQFVRKMNVNIKSMPSSHFPPNVDIRAVESSKTLFDNYCCKLGGWKGAIRTVKLFLTSEYHIITGI